MCALVNVLKTVNKHQSQLTQFIIKGDHWYVYKQCATELTHKTVVFNFG